jgi:hypothetical protein
MEMRDLLKSEFKVKLLKKKHEVLFSYDSRDSKFYETRISNSSGLEIDSICVELVRFFCEPGLKVGLTWHVQGEIDIRGSVWVVPDEKFKVDRLMGLGPWSVEVFTRSSEDNLTYMIKISDVLIGWVRLESGLYKCDFSARCLDCKPKGEVEVDK